MSLIALQPGYAGENRDREANFHGNRLLYVGWDEHLMFCAPHCVVVPPTMRFRTLADEVIPAMYAAHPDWRRVEPARIEWFRSGEPFTPDFDASLEANGLDHKALIRFRTPGLTGIAGSCS